MGRSPVFWNRSRTDWRCAWPCFFCFSARDPKPNQPETPRMLRIKNGRVMDPASGTDARLDIWVDGDRIRQVGGPAPGDSGKSADGEILDAAGLVVAPGFIDLHCHLREP